MPVNVEKVLELIKSPSYWCEEASRTIDKQLRDPQFVSQTENINNVRYEFKFDRTPTVGDVETLIRWYQAAGWGVVDVSTYNSEYGSTTTVTLQQRA